jgi:hypothetical protein
MGLKRRSFGVCVRVKGHSSRLWKASSWRRPIVSQSGYWPGIDCRGKKEKSVLKIEDFGSAFCRTFLLVCSSIILFSSASWKLLWGTRLIS